MKCLSQEQLAAYVSNEFSLHISNQIDGHLQNCRSCQLQLKEYFNRLGINVNIEPAIDTRIVAHELVAKLPPYQIHTLKRKQCANFQEERNLGKRGLRVVKKTSLFVAGVAVTILAGTMISPSFATYVNGVYTTLQPEKTTVLIKDDRMDQGTLHDLQKAFMKKLDLKSTDQGITLKVKEVYADTREIEIITTIEDGKGNKLDVMEQSKNIEFLIKDKDGRIIESNSKKYSSPWWHRIDSNVVALNRELTPIFNEVQKIPNELMVEIGTKKIGETRGNWKVQIPLDMTKAKAITKAVAINKQYTSPQGMELDLKEINFAPSSTQIIIDTNIPEGNYQDKFSYQLVDEQGSVLAGWSDFDQSTFLRSDFRKKPLLDEKEKNPVNIIKNQVNRFYVDTKDHKVRLLMNFHPLPDDKNITFKLHSIYKVEPAKFSTKLNLEKLLTKPVKMAEEGNEFTFKNVEFEEMVANGETYTQTSILIEGTLAKDIVHVDDWEVMDEKGNTCIAFLNKEVSRNSNGNVVMNGRLRTEGMKQQPKELTITYKRKVKEDRNVNWEVPIQLSK